jgi:uncharacterized RDD family membrane protein YckC
LLSEISRLDTLRRVATPEGCELTLRLAGPVVRARAWLIDAVIRWLVFFAAVMVLGYLGGFGWGLVAIIYFVLGSLYPILFEVYWHGQTPGKRLSGLAVLRDDGTPVDWSAATARNLLRFVDALPVGYACALATMWLNRDGKRLGDILAGTAVVYSETNSGREKRARPAHASPGRVEVVPFALTQAEQQALLEFHQRAPQLTDERAEELALLATPLTEGLGGAAARARLARIAEYQMGAATRE